MMTLEQLPPKGVKREQAILELGKDEANGELLFQLVNTEKGKCKTAAQKALAQLEYAPAAPLWAKLVKGKWMGSNIMSDACSDCVSEQIAPVILKTLSQLLDEGDTKPLEIEQLNFCFHLKEDDSWIRKAVNGVNLMAEVVPGYTDVKEDLTFNPNGPKYQMNVGMEYSFWKDYINAVIELNRCKYFSGGIYFKIHLK